MRYIIYGAGAIGATVGGKLHQHGRTVVLIARGPHLEALESNGLRLESPDGAVTLRIPVAATPAKAALGPDDVVILGMKSQDTEAAVEELAAASGPDLPVVCAQNGVENERLVLRRFRRVYGMMVRLPAEHLSPGVIVHHRSPTPGVLDVGKYPDGRDDLSDEIAGNLSEAGFDSKSVPDVMRWKYAKLLANLGNGALAACGPSARINEIASRARVEAVACLQAAGIVFASDEEVAERVRRLPPVRPVGGRSRLGGSSSGQSLTRGSGRIEADYLNGEVVLLGRLRGLDTPINETLQRVANRMARAHMKPGSFPVEELEAELKAATHAINPARAPSGF